MQRIFVSLYKELLQNISKICLEADDDYDYGCYLSQLDFFIANGTMVFKPELSDFKPIKRTDIVKPRINAIVRCTVRP